MSVVDLQVRGDRLVATMAEKLAASLLAVSGRRAISDIRLAIVTACGLGRPDVAASLTEIAEAAERQWIRETFADRKSRISALN
jgi:hypothetical protein